jgi:V/A-type H+-transporting ATPase subunit I
MFRPVPAHWFETLVPRDKTVYALESLAATGLVELDRGLCRDFPLDSKGIRRAVERANDATTRYVALLPPVAGRSHIVTTDPEATAAGALRVQRSWLARRLRTERRLRRLLQRQHRLRSLRRCLEAMGNASSLLQDFSQETRFLCKRIYVCPPDAPDQCPLDEAALVEIYTDARHAFIVIACLPEGSADHDAKARRHGCERLPIPDWLVHDWPKRHQRIATELATAAAAIARERESLAELERDAGLVAALEDVAVLDWFLQHSVALSDDHHHCRITGWTTAQTPAVLQDALQRDGIDVKIHFRPAPPDKRAPVDSRGARLTRPFRLFVNLVGAPGPGEVDPSPLLAVIVPLLFGLMFPDAGHGLVLALAGLLLSRRLPATLLFVPCGIAAMLFGLLFGEFFGSHAQFPALLFCPLDEPLLMLALPMLLGVLIILLGLVLSGIEAHWQGHLDRWLWVEAAVLVLYLSALLGLLWPGFWTLSAAAVGWYLAGSLVTGRTARWRVLAAGLARLAHSAFELALNTLSFLRVGAFALAHAALTHALTELTADIETDAWRILALLVGHVLIITIEGLVVFVQTTRLVLFEFFTRFLRADGRLMRPMTLPLPIH